MKYHYLDIISLTVLKNENYEHLISSLLGIIWLGELLKFGKLHVGSLAGAAHFLKDNEGVQ